MPRLSINNEQYSTENEALADMAKNHGWKVDDSRLYHQGLMFNKGNTHIWHCVNVRVSLDGRAKPTTPLIWQVADLIDGSYSNHRPYADNELERALIEN